jgi:hypothetical protein
MQVKVGGERLAEHSRRTMPGSAMDLCQVSYALGDISAARSSLSTAQRALARGGPMDADARALLAVKTTLGLLAASAVLALAACSYGFNGDNCQSPIAARFTEQCNPLLSRD